MKLRLDGTPTERQAATRRLAEVFDVVAVSRPYPDRRQRRLVRVYLELRLDPAAPAGPGQPPSRELR